MSCGNSSSMQPGGSVVATRSYAPRHPIAPGINVAEVRRSIPRRVEVVVKENQTDVVVFFEQAGEAYWFHDVDTASADHLEWLVAENSWLAAKLYIEEQQWLRRAHHQLSEALVDEALQEMRRTRSKSLAQQALECAPMLFRGRCQRAWPWEIDGHV